MSLTKERRNEIAWLAMIEIMRKQGLPHLKPNEFQREVTNKAKQLGISENEAKEFAKELILPMVEELFS